MICPGMSPGPSAPYLVTSARPAHTRQATPLAPPPAAGLGAVTLLLNGGLPKPRVATRCTLGPVPSYPLLSRHIATVQPPGPLTLPRLQLSIVPSDFSLHTLF